VLGNEEVKSSIKFLARCPVLLKALSQVDRLADVNDLSIQNQEIDAGKRWLRNHYLELVPVRHKRLGYL